MCVIPLKTQFFWATDLASCHLDLSRCHWDLWDTTSLVLPCYTCTRLRAFLMRNAKSAFCGAITQTVTLTSRKGDLHVSSLFSVYFITNENQKEHLELPQFWSGLIRRLQPHCSRSLSFNYNNPVSILFFAEHVTISPDD